MAARRDGRIADQGGDGRILRAFARQVYAIRTLGYALLPTMRHTGERHGAYLSRHGQLHSVSLGRQIG